MKYIFSHALVDLSSVSRTSHMKEKKKPYIVNRFLKYKQKTKIKLIKYTDTDYD